ncbi:MAG: fasciclin domain-containing protein [Verrucomicrobiota bacterium]
MKTALLIKITCLVTIFSCLVPQSTHAANPAEAKTIGRIVRENQSLSNFLDLLEKTETGSRLSERTGERFTVFAPVNSAFEKLPQGAIQTLLDPRNDDRLEEVFNFHVLGFSASPFELEKYALLRTQTSQFTSINYLESQIGNARFIGEPIQCSNGVLYLIDSVLTPTTDDLFQRLQKDGRFTIFTRAITASRQGKLFQNMHGLYTTFAPTDAAFKKLPAGFVDSLFLPENDERLEDIIKHHITEGVLGAGKVPGFRSLGVSGVTPTSAFGQQLNFKVVDGEATIDGAKVIEADLPCANGIVHVIDTVIPPVEEGLLQLLKRDNRLTTLVSLLEASGLDLPVASTSNFTIFAPTNDAWKDKAVAELVANPTGENREAIFGLLARHVITGKHVSENSKPYNKLRTIHGAPIYLIRENDQRTINGISISETDLEGFNGLINVIDEVIPDPMELPEGDISTVDAILFVQKTLEDAALIYNAGRYEESWRYYIRRGQEYLSKYSALTDREISKKLASAIRDNQPIFQFAAESWRARNAFRNVLRSLEKSEDRVQDIYLMQTPKPTRFGR